MPSVEMLALALLLATAVGKQCTDHTTTSTYPYLSRSSCEPACEGRACIASEDSGCWGCKYRWEYYAGVYLLIFLSVLGLAGLSGCICCILCFCRCQGRFCFAEEYPEPYPGATAGTVPTAATVP